jgi:hypothetical protein
MDAHSYFADRQKPVRAARERSRSSSHKSASRDTSALSINLAPNGLAVALSVRALAAMTMQAGPLRTFIGEVFW